MKESAALINIDSDDWNIFKSFCKRREASYKIIYDADDIIIVSLGVSHILAWVTWLEIGEEI